MGTDMHIKIGDDEFSIDQDSLITTIVSLSLQAEFMTKGIMVTGDNVTFFENDISRTISRELAISLLIRLVK